MGVSLQEVGTAGKASCIIYVVAQRVANQQAQKGIIVVRMTHPTAR
jgi:hypothetical protein